MLKFVRHSLFFVSITALLCVGSSFAEIPTVPSYSPVIANELPWAEEAEKEGLLSFTFVVNDASPQVTFSPIPVYDNGSASIQIFEATAVAGSMSSAPESAPRMIGTATCDWWLEGKAGTASSSILYTTIPLELIHDGTANNAEIINPTVSQKVIRYGLYRPKVGVLDGISFIRMCRSGTAVAGASQVIVISIK